MCGQRLEDVEPPGREDQGRLPGGGKLELTRTELRIGLAGPRGPGGAWMDTWDAVWLERACPDASLVA